MEELLDNNEIDSGTQLVSIEEKMANLDSFKLGDYFSIAGKAYSSILGQTIGFIFIVAISSMISSFIPFASNLISFLVITPMQVGLFYFVARAIQQKENDFGNMFVGFKFYPQVLGAQALQMLIMIAAFIIPAIFFFLAVNSSVNLLDFDPSTDQEMVLYLIGTYSVWIFVFVLLVMILSVFLSNIYMFILLRKTSAPKAVKYSFQLGAKKFFPYLGLFIILGLINMVGVLLLGVGILFTVPYTIAVFVAAFNELIGADTEI